MDKEIDWKAIDLCICKIRVCRRRYGEQCLKFNTSVYLALGGPCDYGYLGEFKKMKRDLLKVK